MQIKSNYIYTIQTVKCKKYESNLFAYGLDIYKMLLTCLKVLDNIVVDNIKIKMITQLTEEIYDNDNICADLKLVRRADVNINTDTNILPALGSKINLLSRINIDNFINARIQLGYAFISKISMEQHEIYNSEYIKNIIALYTLINHLYVRINAKAIKAYPCYTNMAENYIITVSEPSFITGIASIIRNPERVLSSDFYYLNEIDDNDLGKYDDYDIDVVDGKNLNMHVKLNANIGIQEDNIIADLYDS